MADESKVLNNLKSASDDVKDYGSVSPKKHQLAAVPTACIFILAVELCERLAFYTFTGTQEFFLEKTGYSLAQANALTTAMNTLCMAWAVFAGWVADVQLGRFQTIIIFGVTYSIGGLLATTAAAPSLMSSALYLFALLVLVPMGTAGIKSNISNFGADQYDVSDPEQVAAQEQFFQWFYMAINVGSAFAYSFLTTLGTNGGPGIPKEYGYFAAYLIASICMLCAVVSFFSVRGRYRTSPLQRTSAMADVCKRIAVELRQCKREAILATLGASLAVLAIAFSVASALLQNEVTHGHVFIFSVVSFALASSGALLIILSCENPEWVSNDTLAGVSLSADDTRNFLKLVPVIITAQLAFGALYNCMQYSFQQQACQMDVRIPGSGDAQFAGSFFMIGDCLGIAIATPIAVGWFNPLLESRLGRYFSHEGKFLFGMFVGGLSVILAAYLELMRRAVPVSDRISNCAPEGVHMSDLSAVWMFLPFLLCGIGEIYTNPVIMHLAYSSSSAATRTLAVVATLLVQALGTAIFGVQVTALSQFMPNDLNNGHIEYGYYMSLGIALFFYVAFVRAMRIFRPV
ncbi:Protein NRT1/ PTR FAMILY 8.5 (AtNPF8.5) (Peptide transporter PTR6) [Durusdinium trenchii]|uniref:Protein NRT1/ PTR FAMILY 8.5 (AtNPF8.5) (Peptide transporter PTR6) n=1 Tax=Durusdinium trenchii TaxID=1381693 RepID=A0ABP0RA45_9DINO